MIRGALHGSRWPTGRQALRAAGLAMAVVLSVSVAVVLFFYLLAMPRATVAGAVTVSLYLVLAPWALWSGAKWMGRATGEAARFVGEVVRSNEVGVVSERGSAAFGHLASSPYTDPKILSEMVNGSDGTHKA